MRSAGVDAAVKVFKEVEKVRIPEMNAKIEWRD
jgi:hypothetical protein